MIALAIRHTERGGRATRDKLRKLWLAKLLATIISASDPTEALKASLGVACRSTVTDMLLGQVASRASAIVRFCEEMERGDGEAEASSVGGLLDGTDSYAHILVLLRRLHEQLRWGARMELLPLLEPKLPTMTVQLASVRRPRPEPAPLATPGNRQASDDRSACSNPTPVGAARSRLPEP